MGAELLLLDNEDVRTVFDVNACLDALEQAYASQAEGRTITGLRSQSYVPLGEPDLSYCLKTMEGALPGSGYMVLRLTSDIVSEQRVDGVARREKLARGPGGTYCGLVVIFSVNTLAPVAIMHDGYIQLFRVACTSALSAKLMAPKSAGELGVIGSSGQAWAHVVAMNAVRKLRQVRIFSPDSDHRRLLAERVVRELGLRAMAVASAREAVEGADLVVAATNSSQPVIDGAWLRSGAHVISIVSGDQKMQRRELDDETMRRAALVIAHSKQLAMEQEQGDLTEPVKAGILRWDKVHDLCDVVTGAVSGRSSDDDITVFKNNVGLGLQFAAVAPRVYELARAAGIGRKLPAEWFLQRIKP